MEVSFSCSFFSTHDRFGSLFSDLPFPPPSCILFLDTARGMVWSGCLVVLPFPNSFFFYSTPSSDLNSPFRFASRPFFSVSRSRIRTKSPSFFSATPYPRFLTTPLSARILGGVHYPLAPDEFRTRFAILSPFSLRWKRRSFVLGFFSLVYPTLRNWTLESSRSPLHTIAGADSLSAKFSSPVLLLFMLFFPAGASPTCDAL